MRSEAKLLIGKNSYFFLSAYIENFELYYKWCFCSSYLLLPNIYIKIHPFIENKFFLSWCMLSTCLLWSVFTDDFPPYWDAGPKRDDKSHHGFCWIKHCGILHGKKSFNVQNFWQCYWTALPISILSQLPPAILWFKSIINRIKINYNKIKVWYKYTCEGFMEVIG